jgi:hypothetical protein
MGMEAQLGRLELEPLEGLGQGHNELAVVVVVAHGHIVFADIEPLWALRMSVDEL